MRTSEQAYKIEVYYQDEPVFKLAYYESFEMAGQAARDRISSDKSIREVRILDHRGKVLRVLDGEEGSWTGNKANPKI